jgi:hemerythrin
MLEEWDKNSFLTPRARELILEVQEDQALSPASIKSPGNLSTEDGPKYDEILNRLDEYHSEIENCYHLISSFLEKLDLINEARKHVIVQSQDFNNSCSQLNKERDFLVLVTSELQTKLVYYHQLEMLKTEIESFTIEPWKLRKQFLTLLSQIEDCIAFFQANPHYVHSADYLAEYNSIQQELIDKFIEEITQLLNRNYYIGSEELFNKIPNIEDIQSILNELQKRAKVHNNYQDTIDLLQRTYTDIRIRALYPIAESTCSSLLQQDIDTIQLLRSGCEFLMKIISKEKELYSYLFPQAQDSSRSEMQKSLSELLNPLYENLRRKIIRENSVEVLCELAEMIKVEFSKEEISLANRAYQDIQERLVFRVQVFISDEIYGCSDLENAEFHPILEKTLRLLSLLYNRVNFEIFKGLAQEAIRACIVTLEEGIKDDKFIESHVRLVLEILKLRDEVLTMYENIDISIKTKSLDFTATKHLFWKLVSGEVSLNTGQGLVGLVQAGAPTITESSLDAKHLLQEALQKACQSLILKFFHSVSDPIVLFLIRSRHTPNLQYESALNAFEVSNARATELFPILCNSLQQLPDRVRSEIMSASSSQVHKAFQQHLAYMRRAYPTQTLPSATHVDQLFSSP